MEDADGLNTAVKLKQQVMAYLMAGDYIMPNKSIDLRILAHILLQFGVTNKLPKLIMDGIRAVAFLDTHNQQIADNIAEIIKLQLGEQMESFNLDVEAMRDAVEHITEAAKMITEKMDNSNNGFQETADQLVWATQELTEKSNRTHKHRKQDNKPRPNNTKGTNMQK
jgi:methyl-accepting chemotaxis protein